jgi:inositol hexakisphosphate/diphosphoinositol-pentakisphosphate kinase
MCDRWQKIHKDFYVSKSGLFDLSKVPDVYDMIRFDILHNSHLNLAGMEELFKAATAFENSVVPQEYGTDKEDKRRIGSKLCRALLEKIKYDLTVGHNEEMNFLLDPLHAEDLQENSLSKTEMGHVVRTRLYFTSESHLHTLLNVLRFPEEGKPSLFDEEGLKMLDKVSELSYLTQVIIRLFEDKDEKTFRCEIMFTPGATNDPWTDKSPDLAPYILLNRSIPCNQMINCLDDAISAGKDQIDAAMSADDAEDVTVMPSPPNLKRVDSICVVSESKEASDKWEIASAAARLNLTPQKKPKSPEKA